MKYLYTFILLVCFYKPYIIGQLSKIPTFQISENEGIYCTIDKSWLEPTVQAIQDRLDLHKYGHQLNRTLLYETLEKITTNDLSYTLYSPINSSSQMKPLVIFAHGGAFVTGSRKSKAIKFLAEELAKRGFVTASIEYRLSLLRTWDLLEAGYVGMQDGNAAIKYFKSNAQKLGIDTSRIFIAGISAGGTIALHSGHVDRKDTNQTSFQGLDDKYGCYNCTGGHFNFTTKVKGVINIVGGTSEPKILDTNIPTLHIYCDQDSVLPSNRGVPLHHAGALGGGIIKNIISNLLPFLKRPEVFGPDYFKNDLKITSHDYIEMSSLMNDACSHSVIVADNGIPKNSGIKILEEIYLWLNKNLVPTFNNTASSPSLAINSWSRYKILSRAQDKIERINTNDNGLLYKIIDNHNVDFFTKKHGNYNVEITAINDLGLKTSQKLTINSTGTTAKENKKMSNNQTNNTIVFILILISIFSIFILKFKNK
jgi:hypothetical protein